jgi:chemotaxis protein MotB|tara:strand:+ start:1653 stop:2369 length:717 start_codon:yes stop_codon:yes gene_type:complete
LQNHNLSQELARAKTTAWALTFADLTTLLLTFFVLLLVILNDAEAHVDRLVNVILDETEKELRTLQQNNLVEIERVTKGIKITLTSSKLFKSLSADVNPEADPILVQIGGLIRTSTLMNIYKQKRWKPLLSRISAGEDTLNVEIRAEGHTDDKPIPMNSKFRNNWELSSARALNLVQRLSELAEMDQHYFSALGYGEFRPKISLRNIKNRAEIEEARAQNRRVEIYFDAFIKSKNETH